VPFFVFIYICISWYFVGGAEVSLKYIKELCIVLIGWVMGMLGFLIAGYTIFATLTKPELSLGMMSLVDKSNGVSMLKSTHANFMKIFIWSILFLVFSLLIVVFGKPGGVFLLLSKYYFLGFDVRLMLLFFSEAFIYCSVAYLFMLLKSFVFNIYHSVMTALAWEYDKLN
jgi:hypothetical protein